jgi:hypothetical protein
MKNTRYLLVAIAIATAPLSFLQSQSFWEWTDPVPLSDSISDNANAFLYLDYYSESLFMFWERSEDSLSTAIWMDNILDGEAAEVVFSDPSIHYRHPRIINAHHLPYSDTLFYLFFETDQNGNTDIYYSSYLMDGSFTEPLPFAATPDNDTQLSTGRAEFFDGIANVINTAAWISNGKLYARSLVYDGGWFFDDAVVIDSGNCSNPVVASAEFYDNKILYQKDEPGGSHLYQTLYAGNNWNTPELFYDSTDSRNPTMASYYIHPCWSTGTDSSWTVMIEDYNTYLVYNISGPEPYDPAVLGVVMGVKTWGPLVIVAIAHPDNGVDEIFMTEWSNPDFSNFSNSGTMNRNPRFFHGEYYDYGSWCWWDYLLWESQRNGHWQIWSSKYLQCVGGTDETSGVVAGFSVYPNPFSARTTISFTPEQASYISIKIYDQKGIYTRTLVNRHFNSGRHQLDWSAEGLAAGLYILKMECCGEIRTVRLVKTR